MSLKRFEKETSSEPPGEAFHGAGKLKSCVVDAMKRICSDEFAANKRHGFDSWAFGLNQLLTRMLSIEPQHRPSSHKVVDDLNELQQASVAGPDDIVKADLRKATRNECPKKEYVEVQWRDQQSTKSFIDMFVLFSYFVVVKSIRV